MKTLLLDACALMSRLGANSRRYGHPVAPAEGDYCLIWRGATQGARSGGAGQLSVRAGGEHKKLIAHRLMYWLSNNWRPHENHGAACMVAIPDPLPLVTQTCGNRLCIAPHHLIAKGSK